MDKSIQQVKNSYKEISIIVHYHRRKKRNCIYKSKQDRKMDILSVRLHQTTKPKLSLHGNLCTIYNNKYYNNSASEFNFKPALKFNSQIGSTYDRNKKKSMLFLGDNENEIKKTWKVYQCQCKINQKTYCCSCNSDAMFEVMKTLYDCYKKKNCENCNCILCGQILIAATKGPAEQERISKAAQCIVVPEKGTPEKLEKINNDTCAAGLLTPSVSKTPSEKNGFKLFLGKKACPAEQKRICKTAATAALVIPEKGTPEHTTQLKEKARAAGIITPSQYKTPSEKERIRKSRARKVPSDVQQRLKREVEAAGISISKKAIPDKLEKLKKEARAVGLLTPSVGKTPSEKNRIQLCRANKACPAEQKRICKAAVAAGLVIPEKVTPEYIAKLKEKARAAGIITPFQGKTPSEKESPCKYRARKVAPADWEKVRKAAEAASVISPGRTTSAEKEKLQSEARHAGLVTLSIRKTPSEKNRILNKRARKACPAEQERMRKAAEVSTVISKRAIREDIEKLKKEAFAAGIITSSQDRTPSEKVRVRKSCGRKVTPDEKERLRCEAEATELIKVTPADKEKLIKEARAAGVITPSVGKTSSERERIQKECGRDKEKLIKEARAAGVITPTAGKTSSEKERIRKECGRDKEKLIREARAAGVITPSVGKTSSEKERIRRECGRDKDKLIREARAGGVITPSVGKTSSEKERIRKDCVRDKEKLIKEARAAGVITPSVRKTFSEKERIRKECGRDKEKLIIEARAAGVITPTVGKTSSEKERIRRECGRDKEKLIREARAAGVITPSVGKTSLEKERIRKDCGRDKEKLIKEARAAGVITPSVGKTSLEKERIRKDCGRVRRMSENERLKKALQGAGITAPLDKLSPDEKEKIRKEARVAAIICPSIGTSLENEKICKSTTKKACNAGIISPTYITGFEKELTSAGKDKLLKEGRAAGIIKKPPAVKYECETEAAKFLREARKAGLITCSEGHTNSMKEKKIKSRTARAKCKDLILKKCQEAGVLEDFSGEVKTKEKASITSKKGLKHISVCVKEEIEEVGKTSKCDRACGCEKRKIRFKHSYVRIKVTSPDFSSICPCSQECIPKIKDGVFTDSEGIKVTVGTALGGNIYSTDCSDTKSDKAVEKKSLSLELIYSILNKTNVIPPNFKNCDYQDESEDVDDIMRKQVIEKYIEYQFSLSRIYRCVKSYSDIRVDDYDNSTTDVYETGYGGYVKTPVESHENLGSLSLLSISITNSDYAIDESSSGSGESWTTSNLPSLLDLVTDTESEIDQYTTSDIRSIYSVILDETNGSSLTSYAKSYKKSGTKSSYDNVYCDYRNTIFINKDQINQTTERERRSYFREYDTDDLLVYSECKDDESVLDILQRIMSMERTNSSSIFVMLPASAYSSYCSSTSSDFNIITKQTPRRITRVSSKTRFGHCQSYGDQSLCSKICRKVVEFNDKVMNIMDNMGTDTCDLPCCCNENNKNVKATNYNKGIGSPTKNKKNENIATSPPTSDILLPAPCKCKNLHGCPCLKQNGPTDTKILNKFMSSKITETETYSPKHKPVYKSVGTSKISLINFDFIKPCCSCNSKSGEDRPCEDNLKELIRRFNKKMQEIVSMQDRFNDQCIQCEYYDDKLENNMQKLKKEAKCCIQKTSLVTPQHREANNTVSTTNTKVTRECPPADINMDNIEPCLGNYEENNKKVSKECNTLNIKVTCKCPSADINTDNIESYLDNYEEYNKKVTKECNTINTKVACEYPPADINMDNIEPCLGNYEENNKKVSKECNTLNIKVACKCLSADINTDNIEPCLGDEEYNKRVTKECNTINTKVACEYPPADINMDNIEPCLSNYEENNKKVSKECNTLNIKLTCKCPSADINTDNIESCLGNYEENNKKVTKECNTVNTKVTCEYPPVDINTDNIEPCLGDEKNNKGVTKKCNTVNTKVICECPPVEINTHNIEPCLGDEKNNKRVTKKFNTVNTKVICECPPVDINTDNIEPCLSDYEENNKRVTKECNTYNTKVICECPPTEVNTDYIEPCLGDYDEKVTEKYINIQKTVESKHKYIECEERGVYKPSKCDSDEETFTGYNGIKIEILAKGSASRGFLAIPCVRCLSRILFKNTQTDC